MLVLLWTLLKLSRLWGSTWEEICLTKLLMVLRQLLALLLMLPLPRGLLLLLLLPLPLLLLLLLLMLALLIWWMRVQRGSL